MGRDLAQALDETAARMASEDFVWVTQAIAINRQVGGNLAEVLDGVGHTIRERNQIRRQVKALSAEGKLSAYRADGAAVRRRRIPRGRPTRATSPSSPRASIGYGLIGAGGVLLVVGGLWLRKVITFKF